MPAISSKLTHSKASDKKSGIAHETKEFYNHNARLVSIFSKQIILSQFRSME